MYSYTMCMHMHTVAGSLFCSQHFSKQCYHKLSSSFEEAFLEEDSKGPLALGLEM